MGTTSGPDGDSIGILREDYQLKVSYLAEHFGRMWTRFSFVLSIQLALFGFLGYPLMDSPVGTAGVACRASSLAQEWLVVCLARRPAQQVSTSDCQRRRALITRILPVESRSLISRIAPRGLPDPISLPLHASYG
jgi:hypothetical protein